MDQRAGVRDGNGLHGDGHRQRHVRSVGYLQQLRGRESDHLAAILLHILRAYDADGLMLRQNRLFAANTQGSNVVWKL